MRIARFRHRHETHWGAVEGNQAVPLQGIDTPTSVFTLSAGELAARLDRPAALPFDEVELLAPVVPIRNVFCLGRNYVEHIREQPQAGTDLPTAPIWFTKATTSVTGPGADVEIDPAVTSQLDWEAELAVVIGRGGRGFTAAEALDHVFGYTVLNDLSARDLQFSRGGQWFLGKSLDGLCPIGPWIVTADELGDPQQVTVSLRVNGEQRQYGKTADMIFPVATALADLAQGISLLPGDVIATGTPSGVGMGRKPPLFLQDGDEVEAEVDAIGVLRNRIRFVAASSRQT